MDRYIGPDPYASSLTNAKALIEALCGVPGTRHLCVDVATLQRCYQQPDEETMLEVVLGAGELSSGGHDARNLHGYLHGDAADGVRGSVILLQAGNLGR